MSVFYRKESAKLSKLLLFALLGGMMQFCGCAVMMKSDPGALEGIEFAGYPGKAGNQDMAVFVKTVSVRFLDWHIASGDITWDPDTEDVDGWATTRNYGTQDSFMNLMELVSTHYNANITQYEYHDNEQFRGSTPTDFVKPFWLISWFFSVQETSCSAILRRREGMGNGERGTGNE